MKKGFIYSVKKTNKTEFTQLKSRDISKFNVIHAKAKIINKKVTKWNEEPTMFFGIQTTKKNSTLINENEIMTSKEGIYFSCHRDFHVFSSNYKAFKTSLKFYEKGESLIIRVDRIHDMLCFIDGYGESFCTSLSEVVDHEISFNFHFLMKDFQEEFEVEFLNYY